MNSRFGGWIFPAHEAHLQAWLAKVHELSEGRLRYQGKKQRAALSYCKRKRTAVDIGAHVGLWSFYLAREFETVHAFEPIEEHRRCFRENVEAANVVLHPFALGEKKQHVKMHTTQGSSGDSWVEFLDAGDVPMVRLDDMPIASVDFVKADCEGYELAALRGAERTLLRDKPVVCVEQKPGRAQKFGLRETEAVDYLQSLGAVLRATLSGDFILSWNE